MKLSGTQGVVECDEEETESWDRRAGNKQAKQRGKWARPGMLLLELRDKDRLKWEARAGKARAALSGGDGCEPTWEQRRLECRIEDRHEKLLGLRTQ